jgi:teichuronic acid biosynthesis glycosyltransferase TuaH
VYEYRAGVSASQSAGVDSRARGACGFAQHHVGAVAALQDQQMAKILFVSHSYDDGVFKVGSHHLTREMARMGLDVAHISTPYSMMHALRAARDPERSRLARAGVRLDGAGVKHLIPTTILPAQYNSSSYLSRAFKAVGMERPQFVFVDQPLMLCDSLFRLGAVTVYRPTDLYFSRAATRLQSKYVERFNAVAATSAEVLAALPAVPGQRRTVIPNGVEYSRFVAVDAAAARAGAVYVGALDSRFDWRAVVAMARAFPDLEISLVGPVASPVPDLPANIQLRGPMHYAQIPRFLARFSIGLLPLSADPSNAGRSPMKLFEYLAAGLYVVATGVRALTSRTDLPGCFFYSDESDASVALERAVSTDGINAAGMESARAQDWREKAVQVLQFAQSSGTALPATRGANCIAK